MNFLIKASCIALAIQILVAGFVSFFKAKNIFSILGGIIASTLILLTIKIGKKNANAGYLYIAALTLLLSTYFGIKYALNSSLLPYALMLILSAVTFAAAGFSWILDNEKK